jgi:MoxR-like ATPase
MGCGMNSVVDQLTDQIGKVLLGKKEQIKTALCCLFARGHLLMDDLPGMGKTTLSHALADVLSLKYNRVQFTSDLLPSDIIGVSIYAREKQSFVFKPGPIFTQLLLADEINRATPKTQSALLEAMAEGQVSSDGRSRRLPLPFIVIATQNPTSQAGTFALPESQLDRFLMCMQMGYPGKDAELSMYKNAGQATSMQRLEAVINTEQLLKIQLAVDAITASEPLLEYLHRLVLFSREDKRIGVGLSPRAALGLLQCAKSWAFISGRAYVVPEDIQQVFVAVAGHRLIGSVDMNTTGTALAEHVLNSVSVF